MNPQIDKLLLLQELDLKIRALNTRLKVVPIEIKKISADIQNEKEKFTLRKGALMSEELEMKKLEAGVKEKDELIRKLQSQSGMIRKNDEYRALMNEIDNVKKGLSSIETEELILMDKIQQNRARVKDLESKLKDKEKHAIEEEKELLDIENKIKIEKQNLTGKRPQYTAGITGENLPPYERLLSKGAGTPVAEVKLEVTEAQVKRVPGCDVCGSKGWTHKVGCTLKQNAVNA